MKENLFNFCLVDNENGPVGLCYTESQARDWINGMNFVHQIDEEEYFKENDEYRFVYENVKDYISEPEMALNLLDSVLQALREKNK